MISHFKNGLIEKKLAFTEHLFDTRLIAKRLQSRYLI